MFLSIDSLHCGLRVARACCYASRRDLINAAQVFSRQLHFERTDILLQILASLCARYGHDVFALRQHPRECELGRFASLLRRQLLNTFYQFKIFLEILALKAGGAAALIVWRQIVELLYLARKKTTSQRAVGYKPNTKFTTHFKKPIFGFTTPQ